jgi:WD40 repeat protein
MKRRQYFHLGLLYLLMLQSSCTAQPSSPFAPEAGNYKGGSTSVNANYNYSYNPITGFGMQPAPQVQYLPSPMGDLVISNTGTNKGSYYFTKMKNLSGSWQYDVAGKKLNCTGILKDAITYYKASKGLYSMGFNIGKDKDALHYEYSKKATKEIPKPEKPNGDLKGYITTITGSNSVAFFDIATAKSTLSFNGRMAATNAAHQTITTAFTTSTHLYEIGITSGQGSTKNITAEMIGSYNWDFSNYKFGILNSSGRRMALLGKTKDNFNNLTYTPGYTCIGVAEVNTGRQLGILPITPNLLIRPFFFNDDRLLFSPQEGGIAISSSDYKNYKQVYANKVNAIALSPDNSMIAFSEGLYFYTMKSDGSNKKQIICAGSAASVVKGEDVSDMCWSPDGKYIALCVQANGHFQIAILPVDGSDFLVIKDADGDALQQENVLMSWH